MNDFPASVVDEDGNVHHLLKKPLGRGGQGVVLRTRSPHIAVKLIGTVHDAPTSSRPLAGGSAVKIWNQLTSAAPVELTADATRREALRRRLQDVRLLPLPDLHLAQPLSMLRDHVGYTMRLLTGMVPIRSLIAEPGAENLAGFFQETGGVRRRLEVLAETASLLARLHAVPLVYADISPNNVFVSESADAAEVWLIDLDNLDYLSPNAPGIFTPGFGAPEVVTGRGGVSTLSDSFSFAVLAFWVLSQVHPFLGDYVEEGGWDDDGGGEDREQLAFQGKVPWVEEPDDDSNRTARGIPRALVLSKPLREIFQRTFGPGRSQRELRPSMGEWADVLRRAVDRVVSCRGCGSTFDVTSGTCCFCTGNVRPAFIHMQVNRWDPEIDDAGGSAVSTRPVWHKMLDLDREDIVRRHVVEPTLADADDPPVLRVRAVPGGIAVEPLSGHEVHVALGGRLQRIDRETRLPLPAPGSEAYLHFGPMDRPHRMAALRYYAGGA